MPANKNALIRYKTIDRCLRNRYRRWTIEDLVDACSDALYDMEGIRKGVSLRTVQGDIQVMRSDKLGYNAPIEVYDQRYYRYSDPQYSITDMPLCEDDFLFGAVCNTISVGGFPLFKNNRVKLDDGMMELLLIFIDLNMDNLQLGEEEWI